MMKYRHVPDKNYRSEFVRQMVAENILLGDAHHRVFFALHEHHILPHNFPPQEIARRDRVLFKRQWDETTQVYG